MPVPLSEPSLARNRCFRAKFQNSKNDQEVPLKAARFLTGAAIAALLIGAPALLTSALAQPSGSVHQTHPHRRAGRAPPARRQPPPLPLLRPALSGATSAAQALPRAPQSPHRRVLRPRRGRPQAASKAQVQPRRLPARLPARLRPIALRRVPPWVRRRARLPSRTRRAGPESSLVCAVRTAKRPRPSVDPAAARPRG